MSLVSTTLQAFSPDRGKTWEVNRICDLTREKPSAAQGPPSRLSPAFSRVMVQARPPGRLGADHFVPSSGASKSIQRAARCEAPGGFGWKTLRTA